MRLGPMHEKINTKLYEQISKLRQNIILKSTREIGIETLGTFSKPMLINGIEI